jgi:hypothetical protein
MTCWTFRSFLPLLSLALALSGCNAGSPAAPPFTGEAVDSSGVDATIDGRDAGVMTYAVCPPGLDASFGSLLTQMFATPSCGANMPNCHSTIGRAMAGDLDYSLDADVYTELLGDSGRGEPSRNVAGTGHPPRVAPGDADASMLYIKLTLTTSADPNYGGGMPLLTPGSVCPAAVEAVRAWIDNGAAR